MRDGIPPTPLRWTGDRQEDLVDRIVRAATYLHQPEAPILPDDDRGATHDST